MKGKRRFTLVVNNNLGPRNLFEELDLLKKLINIKLSSGKSRFPFDGFNCGSYDRDCDGWDGVSDRCECGNRRVRWVLSDDYNFVFGEAY
jgi:hypothetical protein